MQKITELYVVLENRPKAAGELFRILKKKNISIYAVGIFEDTARLYVSDPENASKILTEHGYAVDRRQVLEIVVPNRKGILMELTTKLGNAEININYLYGAMEPKAKKGILVLEVDKPDLAVDIFRTHLF
ncbi:MAG: hypothetical protein P8184_21325 [Calditrichia bacterium]